ncbi:MAG: murein biosynthesis integral membrane protein MurJ [Cytophagales bacterium]|nr:murein biosynthesis integral membrane protein MurJ [Armatimonadota bacterium]
MSAVPASASPSPATRAESKQPLAAGAGRATLLMIGFVLLSRVLGVVRDIVLAQLFGQNETTDIYTAAFRVPDMLYLLVAGGALSTVFVPVFAEYWNQGREEDAWRTFGSVITIVGIASAVLVLVMEVAALPVARLLNPLFSAEAVAQTAALSRILLPAQWCFFVGGLMMGTLNARHRFLIPALGPIFYNGCIVAGGLLLHRQLGIASMTYGAVLGAVLGNFLLPVWEMRRIGARFLFGLDTHHPGVIKVGKLMLPALLGLSLSQLAFWITGFFLPNNGQLSALRNAYNLTQAPIGIFAQASAIVLFPTISFLAAQKDWVRFRSEISHGIRRILFLTVPASFLMAALAEPIIRVVYSGPKFGDDAVRLAAGALLFYSLGTFAWSAQAVLARGFYAMQDTKTPVIITTSMVGVFTLTCLASSTLLQAGHNGLALATSLIATVNMLIFLVTLQKRVGGLEMRAVLSSLARVTAASAAASVVGYFAARFLGDVLPTGRAGGLGALLIAGGIGVAVYAGLCALMRVPELHSVRAMFRRGSRPAPSAAAPTESISPLD